MSMYVEFDPHSWYMGFAIKDDRKSIECDEPWQAFTADGNTYSIVTLGGGVLDELKYRIRQYHLEQHNGYGERIAKHRLDYIRGELVNERISYGELAELEQLKDYIADDDIELLQAIKLDEVK